jgi:hypothetical protein
MDRPTPNKQLASKYGVYNFRSCHIKNVNKKQLNKNVKCKKVLFQYFLGATILHDTLTPQQ